MIKTIKNFVSWLHDHDNPFLFITGIMGVTFIGALLAATVLITVFQLFGMVIGLLLCLSALMAPSVIAYIRRDKTDE